MPRCQHLQRPKIHRVQKNIHMHAPTHTHTLMHTQVSSEWRKVSNKLEGEPEFDALDKLERLETFQVKTMLTSHANKMMTVMETETLMSNGKVSTSPGGF